MIILKIAIYARRSEEKETGESIQNQLSICERYIKSHYENFNIDKYYDDDYSGRNINRPQFMKMIKLAYGGYYSVIVFWKLDRVARNALDFLELQKRLSEVGVNLVSVTEGFDPSTVAGKLMMTMLAAVAEMERKNISQRVISNMNEMAKQGKWLGGVVPFGYKVKAIENNKYLHEDENSIKIVKGIFDKYLESNSLFAVSRWLKNTYGINKQPTSIKRIITNLVYVKADAEIKRYLDNKGIVLHGELNENGLISYGKADKTKEIGVSFRDETKWIVSVGKHKGIISGTEYIKIQNILKSKSNCGRRGTGDVSFLSGLCRCDICGSYMRTKQKKGGYRYFVCGKKDSMQNNCTNKSIRISDVEETVIDKLKNLSVKNITIKTKYNDTSQLKQEISQKQTQIKNLVRGMAAAPDIEDVILQQIRELKNETIALENIISEKEKENLLIDVNKYNKMNLLKSLKVFQLY